MAGWSFIVADVATDHTLGELVNVHARYTSTVNQPGTFTATVTLPDGSGLSTAQVRVLRKTS
jgi:hypothetical protein